MRPTFGFAGVVCLIVAGAAWSQRTEPPKSKSRESAIRVLDEFMVAWNACDAHRLAATCNFPHVRIAAGKVTVYQTPDDFEKEHLRSVPLEAGWHHSAWDHRQVVQASDEKVHVVLSFTRCDAKGVKIATHQALYVVTKQDGRGRAGPVKFCAVRFA
jgi:hypothetical protein